MSENLKECAERMSVGKNQVQPCARAVTMAQRYNWAICCDALQGMERSRSGLSLTPGKTQKTQTDPSPEKTHTSRAEGGLE